MRFSSEALIFSFPFLYQLGQTTFSSSQLLVLKKEKQRRDGDLFSVKISADFSSFFINRKVMKVPSLYRNDLLSLPFLLFLSLSIFLIREREKKKMRKRRKKFLSLLHFVYVEREKEEEKKTNFELCCCKSGSSNNNNGTSFSLQLVLASLLLLVCLYRVLERRKKSARKEEVSSRNGWTTSIPKEAYLMLNFSSPSFLFSISLFPLFFFFP